MKLDTKFRINHKNVLEGPWRNQWKYSGMQWQIGKAQCILPQFFLTSFFLCEHIETQNLGTSQAFRALPAMLAWYYWLMHKVQGQNHRKMLAATSAMTGRICLGRPCGYIPEVDDFMNAQVWQILNFLEFQIFTNFNQSQWLMNACQSSTLWGNIISWSFVKLTWWTVHNKFASMKARAHDLYQQKKKAGLLSVSMDLVWFGASVHSSFKWLKPTKNSLHTRIMF